jgi:hypothetical protein
MRRKMWREHHAYILAPPHPTQKKKVLTGWQLLMLQARPKIECTFDYLKEHLLLVTSFPRSVDGYAVHYIRVLLSYQLAWGFESQVSIPESRNYHPNCNSWYPSNTRR